MNRTTENPATLAGQTKCHEQVFALIDHQEPIQSAYDLPLWTALFAGAMMLTPIAALIRQIVRRR